MKVKIPEFIDGKIEVVTIEGYYLMDEKDIIHVLDKTIDLGMCTCCGQETYLYHGGNVVIETCRVIDGRNVVERCSLEHYDCPGISKCINPDKIDKERLERDTSILCNLIESLVDIFDCALVNKGMLGRKVVSEKYLKDEKWNVFMTSFTDHSEKEKPTYHFFVITTDKRVVLNRQQG